MAEISVVVPVYKATDFLRKCTESILGQTFSDLELILVEDGSPDESGALCDAIAKEDSRVRVIHKENGGVSSARNTGMRAASGRFIAFCDADDWMAPHALEKLHKLCMDTGADSAGCGHYRVEVTGEKAKEAPAMDAGFYRKDAIMEGIVHRLLGDRLGKPEEVLNGFVWRFLFSKELIMKHRLKFIGAYLEDELFLMHYFCLAESLVITKEPLYYYFQNPQSVTRNYLPTYMQTFSRFMVEKQELVERFKLEDARPQWQQNSYWNGLLIAVGNVYAKGNKASFWGKTQMVKSLCKREQMADAMQKIYPKNLGRNKQIVADLLRKKHYLTLSLLYTYKNRNH